MAASDLFEAASTLTDRYQTTVPERVRRALNLGKRDRILYHIKDGEVVLTRAQAQDESDGDDPVLGQFLSFLARDMATRPESLQQIDPQLMARARALVAGVKLDLDAPLSDEDE